MRLKTKLSLRPRRRYVAFEVISEYKFSAEQIWSAICARIPIVGYNEIAEAQLRFIEWNEKRQIGILRCSHRKVSIIRVLLASISKIENKVVGMRIIRVSGTLKTLRKKLKEVE